MWQVSFAILAQIASNFGNEYYDFKNGIDRKGRAGFRRGVTEGMGIITPTSVAVGLLAANVLIVNNYRDMEDDAAVGKRTTVVIFGRKFMSIVYLLFGITGMAVMIPVWTRLPLWAWTVPSIYMVLHLKTWMTLRDTAGAELNPLLGRTAVNLLTFSVLFLSASLCHTAG